MLYPVCVHRARDGTLGVIIPDFPGVFSAADSWDDLPRMVQEAIEVRCQGEDIEIPNPTPLDDLRDQADYLGGTWVFIDVDLNALDTRRKRINISVPAYALREIDAHVRAHGCTRSGVLVDSALEMIRAGAPTKVPATKRKPLLTATGANRGLPARSVAKVAARAKVAKRGSRRTVSRTR